MGVPKFFRWISARYPCINSVVHSGEVPEIDHFYVDMNGILHTCSHPDGELSCMSEDTIFLNIKNYVQFLVQLIRPRKTLFLAVDGVAPRAKMTQQRARRFQSAKEARDAKSSAEKRGCAIDREPFDPCVISPGTEFMDRLHTFLSTFVREQVTNNELWRSIDVFFSGHDCPGEGEHKIREYMSYKRGLPDYRPNERHCIYGMDADLVFLGLTTHETNMCILRENVVKASTCNASQMPFCITYLSVLREYIDCEFKDLKESINFEYDLERIIDDWIFMAFLLGNDFIPHIPNLHIHAESLLVLWDTYHVVLPQLDGYLIEFGRLNLQRFHLYLEELSKFEQSWFEEREADHRWMRGKQGALLGRELDKLASGSLLTAKESTFQINQTLTNTETYADPASLRQIENGPADLASLASFFTPDANLFEGEIYDETAELLAEGVISLVDGAPQSIPPVVCSSDEVTDDDTDSDLDDEDVLVYRMYRRDYYFSKLGLPIGSEDELRAGLMPLVTDYVRMLQWILSYYFLRVPDWGFYYPYHYAPFACDLKMYTEQFTNSSWTNMMDCEWASFDTHSHPVLPFIQQLMILPPDGAYIVPKVYRPLMTSPDSPLAPYFPSNFSTDINGKIASWEAVVLIPFINEKLLLDAMAPLTKRLTAVETKRNKHGQHMLFRASQSITADRPKKPATYYAHEFFRDRTVCAAGTIRATYSFSDRQVCSGFPSLTGLEFSTELRRIPVHIFESPSRLESLSVIIPRVSHRLEELAHALLGRPIRVRWPHCAVVMPVRVMTSRELWELQDFNVAPIIPFTKQPGTKDTTLAKFARLVQDETVGPSGISEAFWVSSRIAELERHFRIRRAILFNHLPTDEKRADQTLPVLIFSRKLDGWSIRVNSSQVSNSPRKFMLVPHFANSRCHNGNELKLTTPEPRSFIGSSYYAQRPKKARGRSLLPSMRTDPFHGQCDGLELDLFDLVTFTLPSPPSLTQHHLDWSYNSSVSLTDVFHPGQVVFTTAAPHVGCVGEVVGVKEKRGLVSVRLYPNVGRSVNLASFRQEVERNGIYPNIPVSVFAHSFGVPADVIAQFTGTLLVALDTAAGACISNAPQPDTHASNQSGVARNSSRRQIWNVGLNLRRNKSKAQVVGWSRFCPERSTWVFSERTRHLLLEYRERFPSLWSSVIQGCSNHGGPGYMTVSLPKELLDQTVEFLTQSGCRSAAVLPASGRYLDSDVICDLRSLIYPSLSNDVHAADAISTECTYQPFDRVAWSQVPSITCDPGSLFMPVGASWGLHPNHNPKGTSVLSTSSANLELLDRVVFCRVGQTVPIGLFGTVIGVTSEDQGQTLEVLFDKEFPGAIEIRGSGHCCAIVSPSMVIKLPANLSASVQNHQPKPKCPDSTHGSQRSCGIFTRNAQQLNGPSSVVLNPKRSEQKRPSIAEVDLRNHPDSSPEQIYEAELVELNALLFPSKVKAQSTPQLESNQFEAQKADCSSAQTALYKDGSLKHSREALSEVMPSPPELPLPPVSWSHQTDIKNEKTTGDSKGQPLNPRNDCSKLPLDMQNKQKKAALRSSDSSSTVLSNHLGYQPSSSTTTHPPAFRDGFRKPWAPSPSNVVPPRRRPGRVRPVGACVPGPQPFPANLPFSQGLVRFPSPQDSYFCPIPSCSDFTHPPCNTFIPYNRPQCSFNWEPLPPYSPHDLACTANMHTYGWPHGPPFLRHPNMRPQFSQYNLPPAPLRGYNRDFYGEFSSVHRQPSVHTRPYPFYPEASFGGRFQPPSGYGDQPRQHSVPSQVLRHRRP
ncbi:unnamed protein product [Dicrocoelium dendriticum]|nr:unnamed protein product [Dicrocoelium dendriticum]